MGGNGMSVYVPTAWRNGRDPYINAFNLNHMEFGIESAHEEIEDIIDGTTPVARASLSDRAITVDRATQTHVGGVRCWVDSSNKIGYIDAR
jgi:hypothetical protein